MTPDWNQAPEWRPIESAPRDGTAIQAEIPGHGRDNVIAWQDGFLDEDEELCGTWVFIEDREPPQCWTDGVCWSRNEDDKQSVRPVAWMALPPPPKEVKS